MTDKDITHGPLDAGELRRHSVGTVEIQDAKGRRRTVQLDELNAADRALAEEFGYKPVGWITHWDTRCATAIRRTNHEKIGIQTRVRLSLHVLFRCQYLWALRDNCHHVCIPT